MKRAGHAGHWRHPVDRLGTAPLIKAQILNSKLPVVGMFLGHKIPLDFVSKMVILSVRSTRPLGHNGSV